MSASAPIQLGTEKISKLLRQYAIPAIIAMTASSIYNMVDSIFIGHGVGTYAIAGLALTFPLMNLGAALGSLVGIGAATLISVLLGGRNYDVAQRTLGNVVVLNVIIGLIYMIAVLAFLDPILYFFGASEQTVNYAKEYMEVILYGNIVTHMYFGLNAVQRSAGHPQRAMIATILTVIINTLLDPLFIYVFGWGIRGAAIATVVAQVVSLIWIVYQLSNKNEILHFKKGIYKLNKRIVRDTLGIGLSPFLMNSAACMIVIVVNQSLKKYGGDLSIAAYGIITRLVFIFIMIVMGLNQGMQPIAGYNYGAKNFDRLKTVLYQTIFWATIITTSGFIIGEIFPEQLSRVFTKDEELIAKTTHGMRIIFMFFPIIGFQMVTSNFFQSLGMPKISIFLSLTRQLLFLLPLLFILPRFYGVGGVWASMPFADLIASIVSFFMLMYQMKKLKNKIL